jgi:YrbI family 3-deoxy-D-manno-octulosonate 8-phosphate phosphatase
LKDQDLGEIDLSGVELVAFDFDGVFTDNTVSVDEHGVESVRCWRSDGLGLSRLVAVGVRVWIVSTEVNPVVAARAKKLRLPCRQGVRDKAAALEALCAELGTKLRQTVYVGNDINDIPAFRIAGFPMAVADAYPEVDPYVIRRTTREGGRGAVREVCDWVCLAKSRAQE